MPTNGAYGPVAHSAVRFGDFVVDLPRLARARAGGDQAFTIRRDQPCSTDSTIDSSQFIVLDERPSRHRARRRCCNCSRQMRARQDRQLLAPSPRCEFIARPVGRLPEPHVRREVRRPASVRLAIGPAGRNDGAVMNPALAFYGRPKGPPQKRKSLKALKRELRAIQKERSDRAVELAQGHIVVAMSVGFALAGFGLAGTSSGMTTAPGRPTTSCRIGLPAFAHEQFLVAAAGPIAQRRAMPAGERPYDGMRNDFDNMRTYVNEIFAGREDGPRTRYSEKLLCCGASPRTGSPNTGRRSCAAASELAERSARGRRDQDIGRGRNSIGGRTTPRGGKRPGAGRKRGGRNPRTLSRLKLVEEATAGGITPLELMLRHMRDLWDEGTKDIQGGSRKARGRCGRLCASAAFLDRHDKRPAGRAHRARASQGTQTPRPGSRTTCSRPRTGPCSDRWSTFGQHRTANAR